MPSNLPKRAGPGRPKGSLNKTTVAAKTMLLNVHEGIGGEKAMREWARENPTEFYKLWVKVLPQEVTGEDGGPIQHTFGWLNTNT